MEVYIEYAIIDNFIMDYLLLKSTVWLTKKKAKTVFLVLSTCIGTLVAVIVPLFEINKAVSFLIKVVLAGLMSFLTVKHKNFVEFFKFFNVFLLLTFAVGGAVIGVLSLIGIDYSAEGINKNGFLPIGVNFFFGYVCLKATKKTIDKAMKKLDNQFVCECIIEKTGKAHSFVAFIDSGNMLFDAMTNFPIVVCDEEIAKQILGSTDTPIRYLPISTVSGISSMPLFDIDSITIIKKGNLQKKNAMLGIMKKGSDVGVDAQVIIGASFL